MALKSTTNTQHEGFLKWRDRLRSLHSSATKFRAAINSPMSIDTLLFALDQLERFRISLDQVVMTPRLQAYLREQFGEPSFDLSAEYTAMRNALNNLRNTMIGIIPIDGSGFILGWTLDTVSGSRTPREFTPTELNPLIAPTDTLIGLL